MKTWLSLGLFIILASFMFAGEFLNVGFIKIVERISLFAFAVLLYTRFVLTPKQVNAWILLPAGMAVIFAPLSHWLDVHGWKNIVWLWPVFLFGPTLGLIQWYFFGGRHHRLLAPITLFLTSGIALSWFNFRALNPLNAVDWWPLFPFLISVSLHFVTFTQYQFFRSGILFFAGLLLTCSLIFFCNTIFDIPYNLLWPFFILSPFIGFAEIYFSRSRKSYFSQ